jgi:outer membrane protein assembly factor BamE
MQTINAYKTLQLAVLISIFLLGACSTSHFPWVYRLDIEQGNIVEDDKLAEVKIGMTRSQVRYLLGEPMIKDTFDQNRWDYYYSFETGKGLYQRQLLTLTFDGEILKSMNKKEPETFQKKF